MARPIYAWFSHSYINLYAFTFMYFYAYGETCLQRHVAQYINLFIYVSIYWCICLYIHIYMYICIYTYIHINMQTCIYMYIYIYIQTHIYVHWIRHLSRQQRYLFDMWLYVCHDSFVRDVRFYVICHGTWSCATWLFCMWRDVLQPTADRVAQNFEILSQNLQLSSRRTRILMFSSHMWLCDTPWEWELSFITWNWS